MVKLGGCYQYFANAINGKGLTMRDISKICGERDRLVFEISPYIGFLTLLLYFYYLFVRISIKNAGILDRE